MTKRNVRNRFRDAMGDYYKTNRQVEEEHPAKRGGEWTKNEKRMLIIAIILIIAAVIRIGVF